LEDTRLEVYQGYLEQLNRQLSQAVDDQEANYRHRLSPCCLKPMLVLASCGPHVRAKIYEPVRETTLRELLTGRPAASAGVVSLTWTNLGDPRIATTA
jgi:hypothetical protein